MRQDLSSSSLRQASRVTTDDRPRPDPDAHPRGMCRICREDTHCTPSRRDPNNRLLHRSDRTRLPQAAGSARRSSSLGEARGSGRLRLAGPPCREAVPSPPLHCGGFEQNDSRSSIADEHQDTNAHQHAIVMALQEAGAKLRIFGDPMQRDLLERKRGQTGDGTLGGGHQNGPVCRIVHAP